MAGHRLLFQIAIAVQIGALAAVGDPGPRAQRSLVWYGWTEGALLAAKQKRPLLVYFHKPYCEYCDRMDAQTFTDARVQKMIQSCFVPVRVESFDTTAFRGPGGEKLSGTALRQRYRVVTFPTILALHFKDRGKEHMRIPGFFGPTEFLEMMGYIFQGWYARMSFGEYLDRLLNRTLPQTSPVAGCWTGT